jgi:tight adherence protein C
LAASIGLAGTEGARVRASLQARAVALRGRQLADAEAAAESATERMSLPVVTMATGFLLFIGYPAAHAVLVNL